MKALGPIDVVVNNAGIEFGGPFTGTTEAELEAIVAVNLLAVMDLTRLVLPGMQERGRGHVVNIASLRRQGAVSLSGLLLGDQAWRRRVHAARRAEHGSEPVGFTAIRPAFITRAGMYGRIEDQIEGPNRSDAAPERVGEAAAGALRRTPPR